jgi:hypothetical protein
MIRILLFSIFISLAGNSLAYEEAWTSNLFSDSRFTYLKVAGYDANGFFVVGSNISLRTDRDRAGFTKRKYAVAYYTDDLHKQWEQYIDLFDDEKVIGFTDLPDKMLFLYSRELRKEKKTEIYAYMIGSQGIFSQPVLISALNLQEIDNPDKFKLSTSKDQQKLMLSYIANDDRNKTIINIVTFNDSLKNDVEISYEIPLGNKSFGFIDQVISNNGKIFILANNNPSNKRIRSSGELKHFLISGNNFSPIYKMININLENKFISDIGLAVDEINLNAVVAGYYSENNPYSYAGVFYSAYDMETGEMKIIRDAKFPESVLIKMFGQVKGRKNKELNTFSIDKIILRNDGGAVVLSEARYTTQNSYYDTFTRSYVTTTNYHYNNILAVSLNVNGTIDWPVIIPKSQVTTNDYGYYSSYCMAVSGDKMHFIYNRFSGRKTNGMMYSVSTTGEEQPTQLFGNHEEATLMPYGALQIDNDVIIIPAVHKRKISLLKLTLR